MEKSEKKHRGFVNVYPENKDGSVYNEFVFKTTYTPDENAQQYDEKLKELKKKDHS